MHLLVSYNWLKEYVSTKKSAAEFAAQLSLKGPTVDKIYETKINFSQVVVGKIINLKPHPNADKLQLVEVGVGKKGGVLKIVCGASNIAVGQKVPVALVGAVLPGDFKISKREVRGEVSQGMLCSAKELEFGQEHGGILILPPETTTGAALEKVLPLNDQIFDVEITSNRPDAMSVIGLAREASAILSEKFLYQEPQPKLSSISQIPLSVEVVEPKLCPRYQAVVLDQVMVRPSPMWLQQRLVAAGLRPINNLVDITNYILLEYGQPLHVFDYHKLQGHKILVRLAKVGEKILALDGQTYQLQSSNLVIADQREPVAVAGVMGGELSAAQTQTKTVVIEAANFFSLSVRKTVRQLNLHSESSNLFEKGLSPASTLPAILRAIELIQQLADGQVASEIIDASQPVVKARAITLLPDTVAKYLGVELSVKEIKNILSNLGFTVNGTKELTVTPPVWRAQEIEGEHDLVEEVARIYGYQRLPSQTPQGEIPITPPDSEFYWEELIKNTLVGLGFFEIYSYSLVSEKLLKSLGFKSDNCLALSNPLSLEFQYLRPSLLPSLLAVVAGNQQNYTEQNIFEIANVYLPQGKDLPQEQAVLAVAQTSVTTGEELFFKAKGSLTVLLDKLGIKAEWQNFSGEHYWHPGRSAQLTVSGRVIGQLGEITTESRAGFDLKKRVIVWEFYLAELLAAAKKNKEFIALPKFPASQLDLAVIVDRKTVWEEVSQAVLQVDPLIIQAELFDVYQGNKITKDKKSLAFRLTYRHTEQTLKSAEVEKIQQQVVSLLQEKFKGQVRQG